jgi:hypothetical protein
LIYFHKTGSMVSVEGRTRRYMHTRWRYQREKTNSTLKHDNKVDKPTERRYAQLHAYVCSLSRLWFKGERKFKLLICLISTPLTDEATTQTSMSMLYTRLPFVNAGN